MKKEKKKNARARTGICAKLEGWSEKEGGVTHHANMVTNARINLCIQLHRIYFV